MKIDILVVSYHARKELAQTLSSIALYSAPGYRLTVHDNTSKNYPLTWVWNRFLERSNREVVALVNSDVIVGPGWDTEALAFFESNGSVGSVCPLSNHPPHATLGYIPPPDDKAMEWIVPLTQSLKKNDRFQIGSHFALVSGHCMLLRKSLVRKVGYFNEGHAFAGNDHDLHARLLEAGIGIGVCLRAASLHWWNASTRDAMEKGFSSGYPEFVVPQEGETFDTI